MNGKISIFTIAILFLTGCQGESWKTKPPTVSLKTDPKAVDSLDLYYGDIAKRVKKVIGVNDLIIIPAEATWPIGTVLRPGTTFPSDATACIAASQQIISADTPKLFPEFSSTIQNSLGLGIDSQLTKKLAEFGVKIKDKDTVTLKVTESKLELVDDTNYAQISAKPDCKSILAGKELWVVRGYALGKRNFTLNSELSRIVDTKIVKIGSFNVDLGSGDSSLKVIDDKPEKFIQIINAIKLEGGVIKNVLPTAPSGVGRIFIQKDKLDKTNASQNLVNQFRAANFRVENSVESIDSSKMPRVAQVRYFNDADQDLANKVAENMRTQFPDVSVLKFKLPAPSGQLEVWLPRSNS